MSAHSLPTCEQFDDSVAELALSQVSEPERTAFLAHARSCVRCQRSLIELSAAGDRMLELAPEVEPPSGFEVRAIAAMSPPSRRRRPPRVAVAAAAAATLVIVSLAGGAALWSVVDDDAPEVVAAEIETRDGNRLGTVELQSTAVPLLVLAMDGPSDWGGVWVCQVRSQDGVWVDVGSWESDDVSHGVWATGLPADLSTPTAMRILGDSGSVIATAELTANG